MDRSPIEWLIRRAARFHRLGTGHWISETAPQSSAKRSRRLRQGQVPDLCSESAPGARRMDPSWMTEIREPEPQRTRPVLLLSVGRDGKIARRIRPP